MDFDLGQKIDMTRFILVCSKLIRLLNEGDTCDVRWYSKHCYFLVCRNNYLYTVSVCLLIDTVIFYFIIWFRRDCVIKCSALQLLYTRGGWYVMHTVKCIEKETMYLNKGK